jgi:hypothetical protein
MHGQNSSNENNLQFTLNYEKMETGQYELSLNIKQGNPDFTILIFKNPNISEPIIKEIDYKEQKFKHTINSPGSYYIEIRDANNRIKGKSIKIQ